MAQSRPLILTALALALGYLALVALFWNLGTAVPAGMAPAILNAHPRQTMEIARLAAVHADAETASHAHEAAVDALATAPLEEEPFVLAASGFGEQRSITEADHLLRIAVRKNPRSRSARARLIQTSVQRGEVGEAVRQVEAMYRLRASQTDRLRGALAIMASFPQTRRQTLEAIKLPALKQDILRDMARLGVSANLLEQSIAILGSFEGAQRHEGFAASLASPLLENGDWEGAYRIWSIFNPDAPQAGTGVIDPGFVGKFEAPFGWTVRNSREGFAQLGQGGLTGEYYGRGTPTLAQQATPLAPGTWRVSIASAAPTSGLEVVIRCRGGTTLLELPLREIAETGQFDAGEDCPIVDIAFTGKPSDPPRFSSFRFEHVELERVAQ